MQLYHYVICWFHPTDKSQILQCLLFSLFNYWLSTSKFRSLRSAPAMPSVLPANTLCDAGKGWGWGDHVVGASPSATPNPNQLPQPSVTIAINRSCYSYPVHALIDTHPAPTGALEGLVPTCSRTRSCCHFPLATHQTTTLNPLVNRAKRIFYFHYSQQFALILYQCKVSM